MTIRKGAHLLNLIKGRRCPFVNEPDKMTLALFQLLPLLLFWQRKLDTWERLVFTGFVSENGELFWSIGVPSKVSVF